MSQQAESNQRGALSLTTWWERYNRNRSDSETHEVSACIRSLAPAHGQHDTRATVLAELESAVQSGRIDCYNLTVLGEQICRCQSCQSCTEATRALETAEALAGWRANGLRSTGFTERTVSSRMTGEEYRVLVPPELSIGVYVDDELVGVFPSMSGEELFRPTDYVRALAERSAERASSTLQEVS